MGFEGANVIFDTWVHPLMMGLEEHLLGMFREDYEFNDAAAPSHLGVAAEARAMPRRAAEVRPLQTAIAWAPEAERELERFPSSCAARRVGTPNGSPASRDSQ